MTKGEVIQRLCILQSEVLAHLEYQAAADCICGGRVDMLDGYRNDGVCIEFIEEAVRAAIAKRRADFEAGRPGLMRSLEAARDALDWVERSIGGNP